MHVNEECGFTELLADTVTIVRHNYITVKHWCKQICVLNFSRPGYKTPDTFSDGATVCQSAYSQWGCPLVAAWSACCLCTSPRSRCRAQRLPHRKPAGKSSDFHMRFFASGYKSESLSFDSHGQSTVWGLGISEETKSSAAGGAPS